ncbi:MAG: hypothetical protein GY705_26040, partial [Bacteroidetes bacterium]|nr:hypothetical protein [Bacteroidota bacterium]
QIASTSQDVSSDSDADLRSHQKKKAKVTPLSAAEKEEQELLEKLKAIREKTVVKPNKYGPTKPALMIDDESKLFKSDKSGEANKVASSLFSNLDEGEDLYDHAGLGIGSTTVDIRIKRVIWDGSYIDLGWLAPRSNLRFQKSNTMNARFAARVEPPKNIEEWRTWFLVYCIIYTTKYTDSSPELFAYIQKIYGLYYLHKNTFIWRLYDEEFRKAKACDPELHWNDTHQRSLDSVIMFNSQAENNKSNEAGSLKLPKNGTCIAWNKSYCKGGAGCKWQHVCAFCKKDHKAKFCTNRK